MLTPSQRDNASFQADFLNSSVRPTTRLIRSDGASRNKKFTTSGSRPAGATLNGRARRSPVALLWVRRRARGGVRIIETPQPLLPIVVKAPGARFPATLVAWRSSSMSTRAAFGEVCRSTTARRSSRWATACSRYHGASCADLSSRRGLSPSRAKGSAASYERSVFGSSTLFEVSCVLDTFR